MSKLVRLDPKYWPNQELAFWCPGCNTSHVIAVDKLNHSGARWTFDGNYQKPTFSPSYHLRINAPGMDHYQPDISTTICHSFIQNGRIAFLADCTHALKGQTVDLPDIPGDALLTCERL